MSGEDYVPPRVASLPLYRVSLFALQVWACARHASADVTSDIVDKALNGLVRELSPHVCS